MKHVVVNESDQIVPPPVDSFRRGETHHLVVDLPGISCEMVRLWVDGPDVILEADCRQATTSGDDHVHVERPTGVWRRKIRLPDDSDSSAIAADCTHGLLHLVAPVGSNGRQPAAGRQYVEIVSGELLLAPADRQGATRGA
jgi:HSP20 family protein